MNQQLNAYSKQVALELFAEYPEWESLFESKSNTGSGYFRLVVPSPNRAHLGELGLTTEYNDEVTIHFHNYHAHFESLRPSQTEKGDALGLIRKLVTEELVLVEYGYFGVDFIEDGWQGSQLVAPTGIPTGNFEYYYSSKIRVVSWRGTYDREWDAPYLSGGAA
jgi:hypothetical protein